MSVPGDAAVIARLREELDGWNPRHRPNFNDLMSRAGARVNAWVFYPAMSAVLVAILVGAFLVMTTLHIGSLGGQPVHSSITQGR
jgi:hypothetical protein